MVMNKFRNSLDKREKSVYRRRCERKQTSRTKAILMYMSIREDQDTLLL